MSENPINTRLLKANNVQRRFYVKEVEALTAAAARKARQDIADKKAIIYNQHVQKAMGAELAKLLEIRSKIQAHMLEIEKLQACPDVRRRLNKRGLKSTKDRSGYGRTVDPLDYYTEPPSTDVKSEDICQNVIGNPQVQMVMMECRNNPPYAKYEDALTGVVMDEANYHEAIDTLRRQIWGVVSTDEILNLIAEFKSDWL